MILDIDKYKDVFGQNNDEPIILIENVPVENLRLVGADKTTINFKFNKIEYDKFKDQELADTLLNNKNSMIIVKCKNMSTSSSLEIFKNLKLVKSCKKYALYETID